MSLIKIIDKNYKKKQLDMKKLLKSKKLNIKFFENNILQIFENNKKLIEAEYNFWGIIKDDNIFIRCQPTDNDGEILVSGQSVAPDEVEMDFNIDKLMGDNKNMITGALVGIIIMIAIMKIGEYVLKTTPKLILGD